MTITITESKALDILAREEVLRFVPSIAAIYEEFKSIEHRVRKEKNCQKCDLQDKRFDPVARKAILFLSRMNKTQSDGLKRYLRTEKLAIFAPAEGKKTQKFEF